MTGLSVRELGEYIREQRDAAQVSLRQLAKIAGVSNPYLSQIERGLRKPSAEILQQIAKALRISAETLYVRAGILDDSDRADEQEDDGVVVAALQADSFLTARQKRVLLDIYESFRNENAAAREDTAAEPATPAAKEETATSAAAAKPAERAKATKATKPTKATESAKEADASA